MGLYIMLYIMGHIYLFFLKKMNKMNKNGEMLSTIPKDVQR